MRSKDLIATILILVCCSCSIKKPEFGQTIFKTSVGDTLSNKKELKKIKALNNDLFIPGSFVGRERIPIPYRLFQPSIKGEAKKLPLVIVFHGSNAIGNDNIAQLGILPKLFASNRVQQKYPAYVLAPQFSKRSSSYVLDYGRKEYTAIAQPLLGDVLKLIDSLKKTLNVDHERIYVVGYSMGGSTAINALSARPDLFAAGISIAGVPQFENIRLLAKVPIWLIHGTLDKENPYSGNAQFFKELKFNQKVRFWSFEGKEHNNIFSNELLTNNLPEWLFKQQRNKLLR